MRPLVAAIIAAAFVLPIALSTPGRAQPRFHDRGRRFDEHSWREREWRDHGHYHRPPIAYGGPAYPVAPLFGITIR